MPSKSPKNYQLRALGWGVEVTSHYLSTRELAKAKKWLATENLNPELFHGSLEDILPKYNCYHTNHWQSGCVPLLDLTRLVLVDSQEKVVFSLNRPHEMQVLDAGYPVLKAAAGTGKNLAVYTEECKGQVAMWPVVSMSRPRKKDFVVLKSRIDIAGEDIWYISGIKFQDKELEADYDYEDVRGKAAYTKILPATQT
jgi:hypothetical protein